MNWPIERSWKCETCGENSGMTWGFIHGQCKCNNCHTQYQMRFDDRVLTIPACLLKDEYKKPAQVAWARWHTPVDELLDDQWDEVLGKVK